MSLLAQLAQAKQSTSRGREACVSYKFGATQAATLALAAWSSGFIGALIWGVTRLYSFSFTAE